MNTSQKGATGVYGTKGLAGWRWDIALLGKSPMAQYRQVIAYIISMVTRRTIAMKPETAYYLNVGNLDSYCKACRMVMKRVSKQRKRGVASVQYPAG
jgi:hypothetical protein